MQSTQNTHTHTHTSRGVIHCGYMDINIPILTQLIQYSEQDTAI